MKVNWNFLGEKGGGIAKQETFHEGFFPGSPIFLPPQKATFLNSNLTWNAWTRLNELLELFGAPWVNK